MPSFILRTIDPTLWATVKAQATLDGMPLRGVILHLLRLYAQGRIAIRAAKVAERSQP